MHYTRRNKVRFVDLSVHSDTAGRFEETGWGNWNRRLLQARGKQKPASALLVGHLRKRSALGPHSFVTAFPLVLARCEFRFVIVLNEGMQT